jgi:hypothetical protein
MPFAKAKLFVREETELRHASDQSVGDDSFE